MHVHETIVKEVVMNSRITLLGIILFEELYGYAKESPFDTESEIKFMGKEKVVPNTHDGVVEITLVGSSRDAEFQEADSDLELMPDDEIESVSGFEADNNDEDDHFKNKKEPTQTAEADVDNVIDKLVDMANSKDDNINSFANKPTKSDILSHLQADINSLFAKVKNLESSLSQQVADNIDDSMPRMVADALEERLPKLLYDTIKNILFDLLKDSVKKALPKFDKRVKKTLRTKVPEIFLKPLNMKFNALNRMENRWFLLL
nr:hypothetical protein [Tanacetum cinerariifolium]GEX90831.1 hypothetical protein [Tanacetum cinerariifolium]